jgi:hypothetical protein
MRQRIGCADGASIALKPTLATGRTGSICPSPDFLDTRLLFLSRFRLLIIHWAHVV